MKKVLALIFGLSVTSGVYAESYTMYENPDVKSKQLAKVDDQNPQYQMIFSKDNWIEIVNIKNGNVGWVQQKASKSNSQTSSEDSVEKMMSDFQKQQQRINKHFNKMIANIDQNIVQMQSQSGSSTMGKSQPKVFEKFSSVTINSDGKTAKIVKKTEDSNGNIQTVEKEVPADQLGSIKIGE